MIALESIAVLSNLLPRELDEWLNSGDLHRSQTPEGAELICLNSLLARPASGQPNDREFRGCSVKEEKERS